MLRMLLHIVGDIHQPLHTSTFISQQFPKGDLGGNFYKVKYKGEEQNWHHLWDTQFGYAPNCKRPVQPDCLTHIEYYADLYTKNYPRSSMSDLLNDKDRTQWTIDSYLLSIDAYTHMIGSQEEISESFAKLLYETVIQK